ncbi:MAG: hypothetical protein C0485_19695 [Pirellula sp.]|nr:hypothetical protein [Pirellula sp.]
MIGVSSYPSTDQPWWTPTGEPLAERPYAKFSNRKPTVWSSPMVREICWRWQGVDDPDIRTSWGIVEQTNGWGPGEPVDAEGKPITGLVAYDVPFAQVEPTCTLQLTMSYPVSEWQMFHSNQAGHVWAFVNHPPGKPMSGVTFDKPRAVDGSAFVVMGYMLPHDQDVRLIAVDTQGKKHIGKGESAGGFLEFRQLAAQFEGLQPADIKTWIVERRARSTESVEFRNVALEAGVDAKVEIVPVNIGGSRVRTAPFRDEQAEKSQSASLIAEFGSTNEVALPAGDPNGKGSGLIDFDSGQMLAVPESLPESEALAWLRKNGVDAMAFGGLATIEMVAVAGEWDVEASRLAALRFGEADVSATLPAADLPASYYFETREGSRGVLQMVEIGDETMKIRYKLMKK